MEPDELEFLGENAQIGIIPNFNHDPIYLISGTIEPMRAGIPRHVPLWLAIHLRQQQKCRLVPPQWMEIDLLEDIKDSEKRTSTFGKMPSENYLVEAKLILNTAPEDVPRSDEIKTLIKDIYDIRCAKLRTVIDSYLGEESMLLNLVNVTVLELHTVQPLLPHAMDLLQRIHHAKSAGPRTSGSLSISHHNNSTTSGSSSMVRLSRYGRDSLGQS